MPTVPGDPFQAAQSMLPQQEGPSPEQLLMTAADMKSRGQLYQEPVSYKDPKAPLKLPSPGGMRGTRNIRSHSKRR